MSLVFGNRKPLNVSRALESRYSWKYGAENYGVFCLMSLARKLVIFVLRMIFCSSLHETWKMSYNLILLVVKDPRILWTGEELDLDFLSGNYPIEAETKKK